MADGTKVTRIKASDDKPKKSEANTKVAPKPEVKQKKKLGLRAKKVKTPKKQTKIGKFFSPFTGYVKGAWEELKQVRWPDRKATWGLTLAVILFSLFFLLLIVLLDTLFGQLFKMIIT